MTNDRRTTKRTIRCRTSWALLPLVAFASGCLSEGIRELLVPYDFQTDPDGDGALDDARPLTWVNDTASAEGGISFDRVNVLLLRSFLQGQEIIGPLLPPPGEVDVFGLGRLRAGDEISMTHSSLAEFLLRLSPLGQADFVQNAAAGLFVLVNGDREIVGYPIAAPVLVQSDGDYFIVVDPGENVPFDYAFTVTRRANRAPVFRRGVLYLNFDGAADADITFPGDSVETLGDLVGVSELPPFDLEQVRPDFPGQTARFRQLVQRFVEYIYADYDVLITTDQAEAEAAGHFDSVVFTSASGKELGLEFEPLGVEPALDVEDRTDQVGIIFIQASIANSAPTDFNSFCASWGSVAAHEFGHAIGLLHIEQSFDGLMSPFQCGFAGGCKRQLGSLTPAPLVAGSLSLVQNPDAYLARIFGRRDPDEAAAIRARVADLVPE